MNEKTFELSYPNVSQFESYSDNLSKIDQKDSKKMNDIMFGFLSDLGLPTEVGRKLQQANLSALLEELAGTAKK